MSWKIPDNFDGQAFAERYGLGRMDFYVNNGNLHLRNGVTLPDDPPIMEQCVAENSAKMERAKIVARLLSGNDPMLNLLLLLTKKIHGKFDTIEKRGGQPTRTFAEWHTRMFLKRPAKK
jgi:hypothetical protein